MVGGYKMIDFKSTAITSGVGVEIKGIHNEIMNTEKETRIVNVIVDGVHYPSLTANFNRTSPLKAIVPCGEAPLTVTITSDDIVTIEKLS